MKFFNLFMLLATSSFCVSCSGAVGSVLRDEADRVNYSVGYQVGGDFKSQGVEPRSEAMTRGFLDAASGAAPIIPKGEMDTTLTALKKKIVQHQMAEVRRANADFMAENAKRADVTVLHSGVQYRVITPGTGKKPNPDDQVKFHMRVSRPDGTVLGSTYEANTPRTIQVSKAMPGLRDVLLLMNEGSKYQVVLPAGKSAVSREPIDDMGVLVYEIELLQVEPSSPVPDGTSKK